MAKVDMRGVRQRLIGEGIHKEDVGEWLEREAIIKYLTHLIRHSLRGQRLGFER